MSLFLPSVAYLWIATVLINFMFIKLFAQRMAPYFEPSHAALLYSTVTTYFLLSCRCGSCSAIAQGARSHTWRSNFNFGLKHFGFKAKGDLLCLHRYVFERPTNYCGFIPPLHDFPPQICMNLLYIKKKVSNIWLLIPKCLSHKGFTDIRNCKFDSS